jgi:hypothetical protein
MKGENPGHNGYNLHKGNILKAIFDTWMEKGHKAFEVYRANLEELFLLRCKVMDGSQGYYADHLHQARGNTRGTV